MRGFSYVSITSRPPLASLLGAILLSLVPRYALWLLPTFDYVRVVPLGFSVISIIGGGDLSVDAVEPACRVGNTGFGTGQCGGGGCAGGVEAVGGVIGNDEANIHRSHSLLTSCVPVQFPPRTIPRRPEATECVGSLRHARQRPAMDRQLVCTKLR